MDRLQNRYIQWNKPERKGGGVLFPVAFQNILKVQSNFWVGVGSGKHWQLPGWVQGGGSTPRDRRDLAGEMGSTHGCCCWWLHVHTSFPSFLFCSTKDRYGISWTLSPSMHKSQLWTGDCVHFPQCRRGFNKSVFSVGIEMWSQLAEYVRSPCSCGQLKWVHATWGSRGGSSWRNGCVWFCCFKILPWLQSNRIPGALVR